MAKVRTIQTSFVSGEFDPTLIGRVDTGFYTKAAELLRNVYIRPQGGAFRREGLCYFGACNSDNEGVLVEFQFNDEQSYVLDFTSGRFDVYRTDVPETIQASVAISGLTLSQIQQAKFVQSADTLILLHKDVQPIKITRTSHTSWTAASIAFSNIPPYAYGSLSTSNPSGSVTPDVVTGKVTVTGTGTTFTALAAGQFINMPKGGRIYITAIDSDTSLDGNIVVELADTSAVSSGDWEYESGYEPVISASRGWPRAGAFYKGRLILGGLGSRPATILGSKVGSFFDLDLGTSLDDEGIDITLDSGNPILNMYSGRALAVFTAGEEYSIRSDINSALTPSNITSQITKETSHGSARVSPVSADGSIIFVEKTDPSDYSKGKIIRQFIYNDVEQSFTAPNASILSQHLISNPVSMAVRQATQTEPSNYIYVVNDDGTVATLTSLREQDLLAWTLLTTRTGDTLDGVCVSGNKAFFRTTRQINGATKRYIECLDSDHLMDCSKLQTVGAATTSWSGLDHLSGETVDVTGDGFILDDELVSSGVIEASEEVTSLEAGFSFAVRVKPMPLDVILSGQSFAGEYKGIVSCNVYSYASRGYKLTYNGLDYKPSFRSFGEEVLDDPVALYTGWKRIYLGGISRDISVEITQDDPTEVNILAMHFEVNV